MKMNSFKQYLLNESLTGEQQNEYSLAEEPQITALIISSDLKEHKYLAYYFLLGKIFEPLSLFNLIRR